ncbi:hypothetical protein [Mesorhizobium waimense]|uniref:hypothetical protein n=1 Tax=Mesorhizobium waimense TaxID=1300307 RepID=UPI001FDEFEAC|nr:hypothetical protein [Mesorhizobium waimense]
MASGNRKAVLEPAHHDQAPPGQVDHSIVVRIGPLPAQFLEEGDAVVAGRQQRPAYGVFLDLGLEQGLAVALARLVIGFCESAEEQLVRPPVDVGPDAVKDQRAAEIVGVQHIARQMMAFGECQRPACRRLRAGAI